jgi:hypothetical protein
MPLYIFQRLLLSITILALAWAISLYVATLSASADVIEGTPVAPALVIER